jgi:hypothetical protein
MPMLQPGRLDLTGDLAIYRGDTWELPVKFVNDEGDPLDVTGWTWTAQIRRNPDASDVHAEITVTVNDAAKGDLTLSMAASVTRDINPRLFGYSWDLQSDQGSGVTKTYLHGNVNVIADTTKVE